MSVKTIPILLKLTLLVLPPFFAYTYTQIMSALNGGLDSPLPLHSPMTAFPKKNLPPLLAMSAFAEPPLPFAALFFINIFNATLFLNNHYFGGKIQHLTKIVNMF